MDWAGRGKCSCLRDSTGDCGGVKSLAMQGRMGSGIITGLWTESGVVVREGGKDRGKRQDDEEHGGELLGEKTTLKVGDDGGEL